MASSAGPQRSSSNASPVAIPNLHLGSFSRFEIADFDKQGRFPTTPSSQVDLHRRTTSLMDQYSQYATNPLPHWTTSQQNESRSPGPVLANGYDQNFTDSPTRVTVAPTTPKSPNDDMKNNEFQRESSVARDDPSLHEPLTHKPSVQSRVSNEKSGLQQSPRTQPSQDMQKDPLIPTHRISLVNGPRHPQVPVSNGANRQSFTPYSPTSPNQGAAPGPLVGSGSLTKQPMDKPQPYNQPYPSMYPPVQAARRPLQAPPQEEICIECMMRDRDMADVDVTSPGIWERESDLDFQEQRRKDSDEMRRWQEKNADLLADPDSQLRPLRLKTLGYDQLTERNLRTWLTMNPKEAHARLMTIDAYVREQGKLLEAEAEARAKSREEAQRVESKVRDIYTQVQNDAYDVGISGTPLGEGSGGVRIQPPRSSGVWDAPKEDYKHKRDVTLLENGMIVERVDVRREDREKEKERKREERKMRKISLGTETSYNSPSNQYFPQVSGSHTVDLTTSTQYDMQTTTSGASLASPRPMSVVMGTPISHLPNRSHTSLDTRNTRFLGFKNWTTPWHSGASVAASGSMIDMHMALDQERRMNGHETASQADLPSYYSTPGSPRHSRPMASDGPLHLTGSARSLSPGSKTGKRKKSGIAKIWRLVKGGSKDEGRSQKNGNASANTAPMGSKQTLEDSMPLTPPPPISYLVNHRGSGGNRQLANTVSTGTHPRSTSQTAYSSSSALSPTTTPPSSLPSPSSARLPWGRESGVDQAPPGTLFPQMTGDSAAGAPGFGPAPGNGLSPENQSTIRAAHSSPLSDDGRRSVLQVPTGGMASPASTIGPAGAPGTYGRPLSSIHKSLPPIPPSDSPEKPAPPMLSATLPMPSFGAPRPNTILIPSASDNSLAMPNAPFRNADNRRQSFSGVDSKPIMNGYQQPHTLQPKRSYGGPLPSTNGVYDEMGTLRQSYFSQSNGDEVKTKRKSFFGLSALLGGSKKDKEKSHQSRSNTPSSYPQDSYRFTHGDAMALNGDNRGSTFTPLAAPVRPFNQARNSQSAASLIDIYQSPQQMDGPGMNGAYPQPQGRPMSMAWNGTATETGTLASPRPSYQAHTIGSYQTQSGKKIEELVERDQNFVAYRYPSADQTLEVPRR